MLISALITGIATNSISELIKNKLIIISENKRSEYTQELVQIIEKTKTEVNNRFSPPYKEG